MSRWTRPEPWMAAIAAASWRAAERSRASSKPRGSRRTTAAGDGSSATARGFATASVGIVAGSSARALSIRTQR